jgi:hypothetical protein
MASGAGLNRVGQNGGETLLVLNPSSAAYTTPYNGYGVIGGNDSGCVMWEAIGFTKWTFQFIGLGANVAGYTVQLLGTVDPSARPYGQPLPKGSTALRASSWFPLPGPSEQSGTGVISNPMVSGVTPAAFTCSIPLVAVRAVLTTIGSPTAGTSVVGFAVP